MREPNASARIYTANKSGELLFEFPLRGGKTWLRLGVFDEISYLRENVYEGGTVSYVATRWDGHHEVLMGAQEFFELLWDCRELETLYKKAKAEGVPF